MLPSVKRLCRKPARELEPNHDGAAAWHRSAARETAFYTKVGDQICGVGFYKD